VSKYKGCPWCGIAPGITKHFKEPMWRLIHRCKVMGVISFDWVADEATLAERWNTRPKRAPRGGEAGKP